MDAKMLLGADRAHSLAMFAAVVEQGSFSAAGRLLGLSPSAVSRTIDRIEERLGVRLLLRSTRALTITAEGQAYLQAARRILADLDDARAADRRSGRAARAPSGQCRAVAWAALHRAAARGVRGALSAYSRRHRAHRHGDRRRRRAGRCRGPFRAARPQHADCSQARRGRGA